MASRGRPQLFREAVRLPIDKIVVHVSGGSADSAAATFQNPDREASYHYLVDLDGTPFQFVREEAVAYHAGWWNWNRRSVGGRISPGP